MRVSSCIHVAANGITSFFFMAEEYSIVFMYHVLIHSSVDGHLGCFHVFAIVNSAVINIWVHESFFCLFVCFFRATPVTHGVS